MCNTKINVSVHLNSIKNALNSYVIFVPFHRQRRINVQGVALGWDMQTGSRGGRSCNFSSGKVQNKCFSLLCQCAFWQGTASSSSAGQNHGCSGQLSSDRWEFRVSSGFQRNESKHSSTTKSTKKIDFLAGEAECSLITEWIWKQRNIKHHLLVHYIPLLNWKSLQLEKKHEIVQYFLWPEPDSKCNCYAKTWSNPAVRLCCI